MAILTQLLSIEWVNSQQGECIQYKPGACQGDPEQTFKNAVFCRIPKKKAEQSISEIKEQVDALLKLAEFTNTRGSAQILCDRLDRQGIPPFGFDGLLRKNAHPQIDTATGLIYGIPWEALHETWYECPTCKARYAGAGLCPTHREALNAVRARLISRYHLSYISRGDDRKSNLGNKFLIIENPTEDASEGCQHHGDVIYDLAQQLGYQVILLKGSAATRNQVMAMLDDPAVVAVYYFGHGCCPKNSSEACLVLANGDELYAEDIYSLAPGARFVFLNACWGAAIGNDWEIERSRSSLAEAFLRGNPNKVVIAPQFPVLNQQAAQAALTFFQAAFAGESCGEALFKVRQQSLQRYDEGHPDTAWMAYRYFGDPNKRLPTIDLPINDAPAGAPFQPVARVFNQGHINIDLFSFAWEDILLRAAKRKNRQQRTQANPADVLAGLLRCGELTRHVLRRRELAPDQLYQDLCAESSEPATPAADNLAEWLLREESQFTPETLEWLRQADMRAQSRPQESAQICEEDLLLSLIETPAWEELRALVPPLPAASDVRLLLEERRAAGKLDENGSLILPQGLNTDAKKIMDAAHRLAQQSGLCPIPNRVMLAAFLYPDGSYVERCFERKGIDPLEAYFWMVAAMALSGAGDGGRHSFGFGEEACERVVSPMLQSVMEQTRTRNSAEITERDLFIGFCAVADAEFKSMLRGLLGIELDELPHIDMDKEPAYIERLEPEARRIVYRAHTLAQARGVFPIPNRALLAAFLQQHDGCASRLLNQRGITPSRVNQSLVATIGEGGKQTYSLDEAACRQTITPIVERAKTLAGEQAAITEALLFQAFCEASPREFRDWLKAAGLDLETLGKAAATELKPKPPARPPLDMGRMDEALAQVLSQASELAQQTNWPELRTPHLLAAMLGDGQTPTATLLRRNQIDPVQLKNRLLQMVPALPNPLPLGQPPVLGDNVADILEHAASLAATRGEDKVTVKDLLATFLENGQGGTIGEYLRGLNIRLNV